MAERINDVTLSAAKRTMAGMVPFAAFRVT
jgi:hypothetical protein